MKSLFSVACLAIFCAACFAQAAPQSNDAEAEGVIAKSKSLYQAVKSKDVQTVKTLLADDFRFVWSDGKEYGKGELLGPAQEGVLHEGVLHDFMFYNPQVTPVGGDSAIVTYNVILSMPEGDDQIAPRYQKVSDLWVRQGGEWKLKFEQATPLRSID
jgi:ketosteroid isomerase-like protein